MIHCLSLILAPVSFVFCLRKIIFKQLVLTKICATLVRGKLVASHAFVDRGR